ncbi:tropomyosin-like [Trachinotus anak]|uniref:tropomyosin-like n=1 Tax=Trachinotus anak TaxID=443729 RepID=UPI0039F19A13
MQTPSKRTGMDVQPKKQLGATMRNTTDLSQSQVVSMQEDTVRELMSQNALLKQHLLDSQFKQHMSDCRLIAAKQTITDLKNQLEEACRELVSSGSKVPSLNPQGVNTEAPQATENQVSELMLHLKKAQEDLEECTAKLLTRVNNHEDAEEERGETIEALKRCIMSFSVRVQREQVILMKKAVKLVIHDTDKGTSEEAQDGEVEKVNLQLQRTHTKQLLQALGMRKREGPTKDTTCKNQEQQTDPQQQHLEEEEAACEIQQLKEKLAAEEVLRVLTEKVALEMKVELHKKNYAVQEAQATIDRQKKDALNSKEELRVQGSSAEIS